MIMINIKTDVYKALCELGVNVVPEYPDTWEVFPSIVYVEENNYVLDNDIQLQPVREYIRYKIDIFNNKSTTNLAISINEKMSELGFSRIACMDVADPNKIQHKLLRFEKYMG